MAYNQFKGEGRVIILKGSYHGGKVGEIRMFPARLLRLSGTNEGYPHLPQGVGHTHLIDGCLAILLSGRADQMNKSYFKVFLHQNTLK